MRPHKLTMKAFGVFAEETVIPFDEMGNEVYLVAGDTGAGKTTIFDALVYALFGSASGSGRGKLNTEEFYSDFYRSAEVRPEMVVELSFSNAGRSFTVHRSMSWGKTGKSAKSEKNSYLEENGVLLATGKGSEKTDDVSRRIREILGLDADQFRKIVMLAQGEFQQFLFAGANVRGEILGQLYKNERQQDLENRLQAADKRLKERESMLSNAAEEQLGSFIRPRELPKDTADALNIDHTGLEAAMEGVISSMKQEHERVKLAIAAGKEEENKLIEAKAAGERSNALLAALKQGEDKLAELEQNKPVYDSLRQKLDLAARAEHVLSEENAMLTARNDLAVTEKNIAEIEENINDGNEKAERALADCEDTKNRLEPVNRELEQELTRLSDSLKLYEALGNRMLAFEEKSRAERAAERDLDAAGEENRKRAERIDELGKTLLELSDAGDAAVSVAEAALEKLTTKMEELSALETAVCRYRNQESSIESLNESYHKLQLEAFAAEKAHLDLHRAFLSGQAEVLAAELHEKIRNEGSAPCPVCGVVHTDVSTHKFAAYSGKVPRKEEVDAALKRMNEKINAANDKEVELTAQKTELDNLRNNISEKLLKLTEFGNEGLVPDLQLIELSQRKCEGKILAAREELEKQRIRKKSRAEAENEKLRLEETVKQAGAAMEKLTAQLKNAAADRAAAETAVSGIKAQLDGYPKDRRAAEQRIAELNTDLKRNKDRIAAAENNHKACIEELKKLSGRLTELGNSLEERKLALKRAEAGYESGIYEQGFADEDEYDSALSPEGTRLDKLLLSRWKAAAENKLKAYDQDYNDAVITVNTLRLSTAGVEYTDLPAMAAAIDESRKQQEMLGKDEHELDRNIKGNEKTFSKVQELLKERTRVMKARNSIKPMAEAANGKLPFSRYVLGGFYRDIVERANVHLGEMTGGEYALCARTDGDGRSALGLNLTVENAFTGIERKAESLSGGQTFEASLSLALGLSEVAQLQSTAAVQIDSLFIDEGFGSLDDFRLEKAVGVLKSISADKRQIGIISHVARLEQELPKKLVVKTGKKGSTVTVVSDC